MNNRQKYESMVKRRKGAVRMAGLAQKCQTVSYTIYLYDVKKCLRREHGEAAEGRGSYVGGFGSARLERLLESPRNQNHLERTEACLEVPAALTGNI